MRFWLIALRMSGHNLFIVFVEYLFTIQPGRKKIKELVGHGIHHTILFIIFMSTLYYLWTCNRLSNSLPPKLQPRLTQLLIHAHFADN